MTEETQETGTADITPQNTFYVRRGLLYMLLATTAFYFASGSSEYTVPVEIPDLVAQVWIPLFFLSGLGYTLFASFRPASDATEEPAPANI